MSKHPPFSETIKNCLKKKTTKKLKIFQEKKEILKNRLNFAGKKQHFIKQT